MARKTMTQDPPVVVAQCRHHWAIDRPTGPTSMGVCLRCGAQKVFLNSPADFPWEGDNVSDLGYGNWTPLRKHDTIPYDDE